MVSVVIPVYNGERFLETALDCALAQTFRNIEIIAVDDGSTDGSARILSRYRDRVTVVTQDNRGCASARQAGVAQSRGQFVAFLDQDDEWAPNKIERQLCALSAHPMAVAVYCDHHGIDAEGKRTGPPAACSYPAYSGPIFELLIRSNCIVSASLVMVRREALDSVGGFDVTHPHWSDDWDLWMRLAERGPFLYLMEDLVGYRRHGQNTSSTTSIQMTAGNLHALLNIRPLIDSKPERIVKTYREALYATRVAMGWQFRRAGNKAASIQNYFQAWRLRPARVNHLVRIIGIAVFPRTWLSRRTERRARSSAAE